MDLELTDEQTWLSESIDTLLTREWVPAERVADAGPDRRRKVWDELVAFGLLAVGPGNGLGAVELCLVARSIGRALASVPSIGSTAIRLALEPFAESLPQTIAESLTGDAAIALALLEPGCSWESEPSVTAVERLATPAVGFELRGENVAIEQLEVADRLAVFATLDDEPALALADAAATGCVYESQPSFDLTVPIGSARFDGVSLPESAVLTGPPAREALSRVRTIGGLLAAAEAVGAAGAVLEGARRYAGERRQFGRAISSFQSLRHMLADMYVRQASGWSTVLYAAAAFDDDIADAAETASVAKAYVSRAAREVAHGAMQVFGGIAFTAEHPAHLYLRRILVREQQFGDASHHERVLGRALAARAARPQPVLPGASAR
jgi:alkylation response protein AidB-like acyl-CoA dehydrogenase